MKKSVREALLIDDVEKLDGVHLWKSNYYRNKIQYFIIKFLNFLAGLNGNKQFKMMEFQEKAYLVENKLHEYCKIYFFLLKRL
jgi:hypothetical protein